MKMNKDEFRTKVSELSGESKETVNNVVSSMFEMVKDEMLSGPIESDEDREIRFHPYGKFVLRRIAPARNRKLGNRYVDVDEQYYISFKSFKQLKKRV